jgi:hypothetical protein
MHKLGKVLIFMQRFLEFRSNPIIQKYENIVSFSVCTITLANTLLYQWFASTTFIHIINFSILSYCSVDLLFAKNDVFIHHALTVGAIGFVYMYGIPPDTVFTVFGTLLMTEMSSFFNISRIWLDEYMGPNNRLFSTIYSINAVLFILSFVKLRIYDFYIEIVRNPRTYEVLSSFTQNSIVRHVHIYGCIYGLFILNLFWFSLICKKLYKMIIINHFKFLNSKVFAETLLQYTYLLNVYAAFTGYGSNADFVLDVFGIMTLAFCSYVFHGKLAMYYLRKYSVIYTSSDIIDIYANDHVAIHMRSFLVVATHFLLSYSSDRDVIFLSAAAHVIGIVGFYRKLLTTVASNKQIADNGELSTSTMYKYCMLPSILDCLLIVMNASTVELKADLLAINVAIGVLLFVVPFYELNHLALHLCLYVQTVCLINCNLALT